MGLNEDVFLALNGARNDTLDPVMIAFGVIGLSYVTFLWVVPLWLARRRRDALDLLVLLAVAELLVFLLKWGLAVERPTFGDPLEIPLDDVSDPAFPSGHATRAFVLATLLTLRMKDWRLAAPLFAYATVMGLSRVYAGVHWPSDVTGGAILGIALALAFDRITRTHAYARARDRLLRRLAPEAAATA